MTPQPEVIMTTDRRTFLTALLVAPFVRVKPKATPRTYTTQELLERVWQDAIERDELSLAV